MCAAPWITSEYFAENAGFDCSVEGSYTLNLPHQEFINHVGLQWSCNGADYLDAVGELAVFDPAAHENGPTALLLGKDFVERYQRERGLTLCWVIVGEKWITGGNASNKYHGCQKMSGTYLHTKEGIDGFLNHNVGSPDGSDGKYNGR